MVVEAADENTANADEIAVLKKARAKKQQHIFRQGIITRQKQRQAQAKANGLTQEILDEILNEDDD